MATDACLSSAADMNRRQWQTIGFHASGRREAMGRGRDSLMMRRAKGWIGAFMALALIGGFTLQAAQAQYTHPLSDTWKGDKLDPKWNVTLLGNAQDQEFSLSVNNGLVTAVVGGSDIWGNGDNGVFIWQPANGDFDVILQMNSITRSNDSVKLGIMVRTDLSKYSPNVFLHSMPRGGTMQNRPPGVEISGSDSGAGAGNVSSGCPADCLPWGNNDGDVSAMPIIHQRLTRRGKVFTSARSYDGGKTWAPLHKTQIQKDTQEVDLPDDVLVGIAMTGHNVSEVDTGIFGPILFTQVATRPTNNGLIAATVVDEDGKPVPDVGLVIQKGDERVGTSVLEDQGLASNTGSAFLPPGVYTVRAAEDDTYAAGAPVTVEVATGKTTVLNLKVGAAK
jgi:hypothetical protein